MVSSKNMWYVSLFMIILLTSVTLPFGKKDTIESLNGGKYPYSVNNPILADTYDVYKNPGYDNKGASDIYVNYPQFPSKHCTTNNVRYWRRPTNGQCTPPGFCMGLYKPTEPSIPSALKTPPITPKDGHSRVNYYVSEY